MLPPRACTSRLSAPSRRGNRGSSRPARRGRHCARLGERAAPPSPPPRRLCPLNRSPSRLQLISHVTFYLLFPGASCPRTVLLGLPRVAPPQTAAGLRLPQLRAKRRRVRAPSRSHFSARASGAPRASLGQESGGRGRERALAAAGSPSDPRGATPRRAAGCPALGVRQGGALRQPGPERARPGASWPRDGFEAAVSPPRPHHAEERALQRGARPVPGLPGPKGGHQARLPEQEGSRGEPLAREVVRSLPECALLLRGRAERPPGGHVSPGGLQLRADARAAQGRGRAGRRPGRAGQAGTIRPSSSVSLPPAVELPVPTLEV